MTLARSATRMWRLAWSVVAVGVSDGMAKEWWKLGRGQQEQSGGGAQAQDLLRVVVCGRNTVMWP